MCSSRSSVVKGSVRSSSLDDSKSEAVELEPFETFVDPWVARPEFFKWEFFRVDAEGVDFGRFFFLVLVAVDDLRMMLILSIVYLMRGEIRRFLCVYRHFFRYILTSESL
jgi:hypothetical protein